MTLTIPDNIGLNEKTAKRFLAAKLYESGKLSLGQAAKLDGLSKVAFSEILADYNVSLFNYDPSEIGKDVENF
jgi:predicted HTH domain antitoxin